MLWRSSRRPFIVASLPSKEATMSMDADYAAALGGDMAALAA